MFMNRFSEGGVARITTLRFRERRVQVVPAVGVIALDPQAGRSASGRRAP